MSMVEVHSLPCPGCGDRITIAATVPQFMAYMSRGQFVQDIFPELDAETRERFISGVCPPCWEEMYPEEVCEDCGGECDGGCEYADDFDEEGFAADLLDVASDEEDYNWDDYSTEEVAEMFPESDLLNMADDNTYDSDWYVD